MVQPVPVRSSRTLNDLGQFTNGCISSFGMLAVVNPFEKIKTEIMSKKMPSLNGAMRGFGIGCAALIPSQGTAFLTYDMVLRYLARNRMDKRPTEKDKALATFGASFPMSLSAVAFERIKVIQQLERTIAAQRAAERIIAEEGYEGLLKGLSPTIVRKFLYAGGLLNVNDSFEKWLAAYIRQKKLREILASATTGAFVGWLSSPPDRIRILMQGDRQNIYRKAWATTRKVLQTEGVLGLFKGSLARSWQISLSMTLMAQGKEYFPQFLPSYMHRTAGG